MESPGHSLCNSIPPPNLEHAEDGGRDAVMELLEGRQHLKTIRTRKEARISNPLSAEL